MVPKTVRELKREDCVELYKKVLHDYDAETMRRLCKEDMFFLMFFACRRVDMNNDWCFARIREVEADPDEHLDLWAREHYKSSIITFGKTIQDILNNPELTVGIFSHTRPIAKAFLSQIKREFELNTFLKGLFPDVLWTDPQKEAPKWSLDDGIIVKRKGNPKESTVEACGLVDGQPTSKHFGLLVYDDIVTKESVSTPEMIAKVTESFGLSLNLAATPCRKRFIGTRYHAMDTYQAIMDRKTAKPRIYPATKDGTVNGEPVFLSREVLNKKFDDMQSYVFSCQMLQNPLSDKAMGFKKEWLMFYSVIRNSSKWNFYVLVDPAGEKKKGSDYTVILVIGLAPDGNYYLVDGLRDRLNLTERTKKLFGFVRDWSPVNVGYEKYGLQSDIEHIKYVQEQEGYRFRITELGGSQPKNDRIRRLVPIFEQGRFYLPHNHTFISAEGKAVDLIRVFIDNEYTSFPVCSHDDMLDCMSRIVEEDLGANFPRIEEETPLSIASAHTAHDVLSRGNTDTFLNTNIEHNLTTMTWKQAMTRR